MSLLNLSIAEQSAIDQNKLPKVAEQIEKLLARIGERGICRSCGATIYWIATSRHDGRLLLPSDVEIIRAEYGEDNITLMPYNTIGINHFMDCPSANQHRKKT